jgi:hypothetical protein
MGSERLYGEVVVMLEVFKDAKRRATLEEHLAFYTPVQSSALFLHEMNGFQPISTDWKALAVNGQPKFWW